MDFQAVLIGLIFAIIIAIFWHRPWRGFVGMTFKALICFLGLLSMGFRKKLA